MSAENIIRRIRDDAEKEIRQILKDAEKQADVLIARARENTQQEAEHILSVGKTQSENTKKILVSKALQDIKRNLLNARENLIDDCFTRAMQQLSTLQGDEYKTIISRFIKNGTKTLGEKCTVLISRDLDREIAKKEGVPVIGTIHGSGGIMLRSEDGKITIDNTFEGILKRKKDEIRIKVGKILFP